MTVRAAGMERVDRIVPTRPEECHLTASSLQGV